MGAISCGFWRLCDWWTDSRAVVCIRASPQKWQVARQSETHRSWKWQTTHPVIAAFTDQADNNVRFLAGRKKMWRNWTSWHQNIWKYTFNVIRWSEMICYCLEIHFVIIFSTSMLFYYFAYPSFLSLSLIFTHSCVFCYWCWIFSAFFFYSRSLQNTCAKKESN